MLIAVRVLGEGSVSQARILEGLITEAGFIGGGAILKHAKRSSGTATVAAEARMRSEVLATALRHCGGLTVTTFVALRWMQGLK
jgi:putative Mg2+ transporter-C (MgtC) family protein